MEGVQNSGNAGIGPNSAEQTQVQAQQAGGTANAPETIELSRYKELEAFATKARQNEILFATKAAQLDPNALNVISDPKVQNAVVKELYGLDTLAQAKEVYGDSLFSNKKDQDEPNELESLRKEFKLIKVKSEADSINLAINSLRATNPDLLKSDKDEELLRKEMSLISSQLSPEERVKKAAKLAFGDLEAIKAQSVINSQNAGSGSGTATAQNNMPNKDAEMLKSFIDSVNPYKQKK